MICITPCYKVLIKKFFFFVFVSATSADYKLLETLNKLATDKYSEMSSTANNLIGNMENINEKCKHHLKAI